SSQHRGVLQERSANWPLENTASPLSGAQHPPLKLSRSQSPIENAYPQQATAAGNYYTGSLHAQHMGLAGCGVERSEKQIAREIKRLYALLDRSDKYQKYREKQPVLTIREFIEREEREAKMKIDKDNKSPEKSVWPEFLELAFWRALIRWPPMGRKKFMLDGALRGRNELIQDSICKDTGIRRDRKQVSSHLQVLKQHLKDQPGVLVYMATKDEDKKRHRGRDAANSYHLSHLGGRHHPQQRVGSGSKYDYNASAPFWSSIGSMHSSLGLGLNGVSGIAPYTVTDFTMLVEDSDQPVHDFTQLSGDGRQQDLHVTDTSMWNRQYPEFAFLQKQADEWTKKHQKVLVCDASIKVMTETRPNAHLSIAFDLHSQRDLRPFESLVCTTRFYDDGKMDTDPQFDGPHHHDLKEHRTSCEYTADPHSSSGRLRLAFGSRFWVNRMSKYQSLRHKDENLVSRSLMRLTATQDVYGVNPSGAAECVLTILWRFRQTRDSAEVGVMKWRAVSFGNPQTSLKQEWAKQESIDDISDELLEIATTQPTHSNPLYHPLAYAVQPYQTQPPQLHIDTLTAWPCTAPDLATPSASAAPSTATDHSFASLPNLSHSQDTASGFDANDFDFTGGRIDISGAFSPAIMAQYETYSQPSDLGGLNALAGMDHQSLLDMGLSAHDIASIGVTPVLDPSLSALGVADPAPGQPCYSTKPLPAWAHSNAALISSLESQAE
ncbi:TEA/ATTS domain family-domain-containing protein, partial [Boeremia exigua]|uniref:TEA/ATTS domain family-domain-containing protein n=1 Tax=Boeremia exigua TaxID=749465 RepID=UPI001E8D6859